MAPTAIDVVHVWFGFDDTASPSSTTAGNVPPAVQPPVDDENSVRAMAFVLSNRRTLPAVSATAWFVDGDSVAPFQLMPPYTWHDVVSQVFATPGQRFSDAE